MKYEIELENGKIVITTIEVISESLANKIKHVVLQKRINAYCKDNRIQVSVETIDNLNLGYCRRVYTTKVDNNTMYEQEIAYTNFLSWLDKQELPHAKKNLAEAIDDRASQKRKKNIKFLKECKEVWSELPEEMKILGAKVAAGVPMTSIGGILSEFSTELLYDLVNTYIRTYDYDAESTESTDEEDQPN